MIPARVDEVRPARFPEEAPLAAALFREYSTEIQVDLCFQNFAAELADLSRMYSPPTGQLLLAITAGEVAGCVAVRGLEQGVCEMKRLYVRPALRSRALGRKLCLAAVDTARRLGYLRMRLDTLDSMAPARALYASLGFREIPAYYVNPNVGVKYLELDLVPRAAQDP